jgi:long-chain acyl-CoA synthetase
MIDFLVHAFRSAGNREAIVWHDKVFAYSWLLERLDTWRDLLRVQAVPPGAVVVLEADFSPNAVALFLALVEHGCVLTPLTSAVEANKADFIEIAQGEFSCRLDAADQATVTRLPNTARHVHYQTLRQRQHPGLVLFSSGSSGKSKAAVHDLGGILEKFKVRRHQRRAIAFLLYDHIGGVNTMLYTLSNTGCLITVPERSPDKVLQTVEKYHADLLPASPTFLNLILLSEAYRRYDLSSLHTVTYGTEPMPESTLKRFHRLFPALNLQQTYGLSEVGILRSKSQASDSLWVKVGGDGFETRIVNGVLQIKAQSAMLGYLNAVSPFTTDGWFDTGDAVEVDGEYIKILGRQSEMINVGGEKVYPAEVESIVQEMDNVAEVVVHGEPNPITGQIVCAQVRLAREENRKDFARRLKRYCGERLQRYKVPVAIRVVETAQYNARFKKKRVTGV